MPSKKIIWTAVLLLAVGFFAFGFKLQGQQPFQQGLRLWFLNVGQGDAILIDTPDRYQILIDGGPNEAILTQLGKSLGLDKEIDLVVVTHNDSDHLKGVLSVLRSYEVNKIWVTGKAHTSQVYLDFVEIIKQKGIPVELVKSGVIFDSHNLQGRIVYPYSVTTSDGQNESSIVSHWQYQGVSFLLTGDIELAQEEAILGKAEPIKSDILKVAHHGSSSSTSSNFLQAVRPKVAVISVGKNSYGHPSDTILARLKAMSVTMLRTDTDKTILFNLNGGKFSYQTGL